MSTLPEKRFGPLPLVPIGIAFISALGRLRRNVFGYNVDVVKILQRDMFVRMPQMPRDRLLDWHLDPEPGKRRTKT